MNILLINPSQYHAYGGLPFSMSQIPLGLAYIAAVLKQNGHKVEILDIDLECASKDAIKDKLMHGGIGLVGITTTTPTYNNALSLAKTVKDICNAYIVLGGIHVTMLPEESVANPQIDFVVAGEGEVTILELVVALEKGSDLAVIDGLVFKKDGKIIKNKPRLPINNLDSIPFPARELFHSNKYTYPDSLHSRTAPMMTSRGCFGKCKYCLTPLVSGNKLRFRSAKNVVDEISILIDRYGIQEIHFWDDNFIGLKNRVFEIRDDLKRRNIKLRYAFPNGVRADFISEEVLVALKDMGTYSIAIGVESGSQDILDFVNKNIKLSQIRNVFNMLKRLKFETWAFFMLGLPMESEETIRKTIDFAKELDPDVAKFHIFKPFPGSPLFSYMKGQGLIDDFDYDSYGLHSKPVHRLEKISGAGILEWQKKAYRKFYLRPKKILLHLLRLKSFYRIRLNILIATSVVKKIFK